MKSWSLTFATQMLFGGFGVWAFRHIQEYYSPQNISTIKYLLMKNAYKTKITNSRRTSRPGIIDAVARYRAAARRLRNTGLEPCFYICFSSRNPKIYWTDLGTHTSICLSFMYVTCKICRYQWPRGLRRGSAAARLLRLWVRIPPGLCCEFLCVVRWRSLWRADHSSRGVVPTVMRRCVWSRNLVNEKALAHWGSCRAKNKPTCKIPSADLKLTDSLTHRLYLTSCWLTGLQNQEASGLKQRWIDCVLSLTGWLASNVATRIWIRTKNLRPQIKTLPPLLIFVSRSPWHPFIGTHFQKRCFRA